MKSIHEFLKESRGGIALLLALLLVGCNGTFQNPVDILPTSPPVASSAVTTTKPTSTTTSAPSAFRRFMTP